jgi:hypothetical protein
MTPSGCGGRARSRGLSRRVSAVALVAEREHGVAFEADALLLRVGHLRPDQGMFLNSARFDQSDCCSAHAARRGRHVRLRRRAGRDS